MLIDIPSEIPEGEYHQEDEDSNVQNENEDVEEEN